MDELVRRLPPVWFLLSKSGVKIMITKKNLRAAGWSARGALCGGLLAASLASPAAHAGLVINAIYDPTVNAYGGQVQTAFNVAAQEFSSRFTDDITINIKVQAGSTGLGGSSTFLIGFDTYAGVRAALAADATSATDAIAIASLGVTDPTHGGGFLYSTAQAKALGLINAHGSSLDGVFTFTNAANTFTFDPNQRAVPGKYDFIAVAQHEISEIMGRIPILGDSFGNGPDYTPYDLFRYTAAGTRDLTGGANVYFSVDGGLTAEKTYNSIAGADPQDWASGNPADAFNAFGTPGVQAGMTAVDVRAMDVIGYNVAAVPEPETYAMLVTGLGLIGLSLRRRRG